MRFRKNLRHLVAALAAAATMTASGALLAGDSFQQGLDAYLQGDYQKAMAIWKPAAESGDQVAAFNVGVLYAQGLGVKADPGEAVRWYRQSALAGYASAQFNLGAAYYHGEGTEVNLAQAVSWWEKAARQDHPEALYNLATLYRRGEGVAQDTGRAISLFQRAADLGDTRAQEALADLRTKHPEFTGQTAGAGEKTGSGTTRENTGSAGAAAQTGAAQPAGTPPPQDSVAGENPEHWTVQVFAADGRDAAQRFVRSHGLAGKVRIYQARVKGKTWFKGIYGSYPDKAAAGAAQAELKKKLPGASPWLRSFRAIQAEALPGTTVETTGTRTRTTAAASAAGGGHAPIGSGSTSEAKVSPGTTTTVDGAASGEGAAPGGSGSSSNAEPDTGAAEEEDSSSSASVTASRETNDQDSAATPANGKGDQAALRKGQRAFNAQDYGTAFEAWRPLAEKGVAEAQYGIAFMYESGWGVDKDYAKAFHWYELAAQQGHVKSEFNLGMLYMNGEGVARNEALGLYWIQSAADRGDDRAAVYLKNLD